MIIKNNTRHGVHVDTEHPIDFEPLDDDGQPVELAALTLVIREGALDTTYEIEDMDQADGRYTAHHVFTRPGVAELIWTAVDAHGRVKAESDTVTVRAPRTA